ncbi:RNA helicase [Gloeocapsa sp. PCC 73106]|uniref:DEAD/DEAH box helicase n=1 Tax=Gloeocapsa sp. PCC 73106 TaxID=102232 RepID=UPI0002AC0068|nr:DEAD/DEAH box helicase [Gloeocapsa sp. PCC 73106]ELR97635.1 superfamily II RNA helicase [Gloeocapsa sp. PCC 73106]
MKESSGIYSSLNLKQLFPFELDDFQLQAIAAQDEGDSVVVCAPTGSGKTLIGEYAIYRALAKGKRVFYTTPLKALSNQKFRDFQEIFTENHQVGLITGDIIIKPDASVVVMTTEIFRNMLYETPIGQVGTSLEDVESVVLDECHYISDPQRGTVWEESIIYCSTEIQLVALSATIGNPEELTDWINSVRTNQDPPNKCQLINSDFRPVPLRYYFSTVDGLFPLLNQKQNQINSKLKAKSSKKTRNRLRKEDCPSIFQVINQLSQAEMLPAIYIIFSRRGCEQAMQTLASLNLVNSSEEQQIYLTLLRFLLLGQSDLRVNFGDFTGRDPELQEKLIVDLGNFGPEPELQEKLLSFLANNPNAELELWQYLEKNPNLKQQILIFLVESSEVARIEQIYPLLRGVASHHAGLLPPWKELVEKLFELGLIKVVFATATLAAGINMPARTTVISALSKRTESGHSTLSPSEFLQIAGRAGRRGKDSVGHVVTMQTPFEGAEDAARLATANPEPLVSQFTPSYGMVLNLLQKHSLSEIKDLLELSFAEYLEQLKLAPSSRKMGELTSELAQLDIKLAELERSGIGAKEIESYQKLKEHLKEEQRLLELLQHQAQTSRKKAIAPELPELVPGNIIALKGKNIAFASPLTALLIDKIPGPGQAPDLLCLGADNYWYVATYGDVVDINPGFLAPEQIGQLSLPDLATIKLGRCGKGDRLSEIVTQTMLKAIVPNLPTPEITEQQQRVDSVQDKIDAHPLAQRKNPIQIIKNHKQRLLLREQLIKTQDQHQNQIKKSRSSYYWREFIYLIQILLEFQALEEDLPINHPEEAVASIKREKEEDKCYRINPLGEAAALIRGENELWLAIALTSGAFERLTPHELASAVSALITEPPRPDTWVDCEPSPLVLQLIIDLKESRRRLNQVQGKYKAKLTKIPPVFLETELLGLVEQWALGLEWYELSDLTNLDEGDIVRLLRRTIDMLWQIPQIPEISSNLRDNANKAIALLKRFPI